MYLAIFEEAKYHVRQAEIQLRKDSKVSENELDNNPIIKPKLFQLVSDYVSSRRINLYENNISNLAYEVKRNTKCDFSVNSIRIKLQELKTK